MLVITLEFLYNSKIHAQNGEITLRNKRRNNCYLKQPYHDHLWNTEQVTGFGKWAERECTL